MIGQRQEGPYVSAEQVTDYAALNSSYQRPNAILAARRTTVVDIELIDGTVCQGLRLTKGILYPIDFIQVLNSTPRLSQSELWVFYLPQTLKAVSYV